MGYIFIIDPGHGGSDPGACAYELKEKDLNLSLALLVKAELERHGQEVILTRDSDTDVNLWSRGELALTKKALCFISVHFNATNGKARGFESWYSVTPQDKANSASWIGSRIGIEVAKLGMPVRGNGARESTTEPGQNYYAVLKACQGIAGLILEGGFIDNTEDVALITSDGFLKKLSQAYMKGICAAYGWAYVEEKNFDIAESLKAQIEDLKKQVIAKDTRIAELTDLYYRALADWDKALELRKKYA